MAAGFDKDGEVPDACWAGLRLCRGRIDHPLPQPGNPKPRLFRLEEDRAVINRMGFNNGGAHAAHARLAARATRRHPGHQHRRQQGRHRPHRRLRHGAQMFAPLASYLAVNVSSPNTPGLRACKTPPRWKNCSTA
jgi:dihydroorotate dehydrogenase